MSTTFHGTQVELYVERLAAETVIAKEFIGILSGGAVDQDLYTKMFPITTDAGVTTDAETEVNVYTNEGTLGSWVEYADDGSDFVITGATGLVTIKAAENQGGNAGERISIDYYTIFEVARGQNVALDYEREILEIYELGDAAAQELKEGKISIKGTIGALYVNRALFGLILSMSDFYERATDMPLYVYPNGKTAGQPRIKCSDAKFSRGHIEASIDAVTVNDMDFVAIAVAIDTVPA